MARPVKCPYCNHSFDRDKVQWKKHNNRFYHLSCYQKQKNETDSYTDLINYICLLRDWKAPTGFVLKQIKRFKEEKDFTYNGMKMTLFYLYKVLEEDIPQDDTIGIGAVEYKYYEAQKYFQELLEVKKHNARAKVDKTPRVIKVKNKKSKRAKTIDLGDLI